MSSKILDILAKRHDEWVKMAKSFKLNNNDAKELVQEMYLRMYNYTKDVNRICLLYTSPSPRDGLLSRMPSSA